MSNAGESTSRKEAALVCRSRARTMHPCALIRPRRIQMQPLANLIYPNPSSQMGDASCCPPVQLSPPARCTEAEFFRATISLLGTGRHDGHVQSVPLPPPAKWAASYAALLLLGAEGLPWWQILATLRCPSTGAHPHSNSVLFQGSPYPVLIIYTLPLRDSRTAFRVS